MSNLREKRSDWDFKDYEVKVDKTDNCLIHTLQKGNSYCGRVIFINTNGIMAVTGDFYNWIFCREFHPSKDGYVSDMYWAEKLQISSDINPYKFDADGTIKQLEYEKEKGCEESGYEDEQLDEMKEYYDDCINYCEDSSCEESYLTHAHENLPDFVDYESVIHVTNIKPQLQIIFDAFEEICSRME